MRLRPRLSLIIVGLIAAILATATAAPAPFAHPGLLHTKADLDHIRAMVAAGAEPWQAGFEKLRSDPQSSADWKVRGPREIVNRPGAGNAEMWMDANAAYQNALMFCLTGDEAHARKAVEILNAWDYALKSVVGHDAQLAAGLYGFKLVSAAELIRASYPAWPARDIDQAKRMFREAIYPTIQDFATFANGNWDGACLKAILAIGVFCDDRAIFDRAVGYYLHGPGNGAITHYIVNETGQCQESGRDQAHTQLGLGLLAECCEIGWNQGLDLYAAAGNRLLKGYEYAARYNLGHDDVPFAEFTDTTGKYHHKAISAEARGRFRAVWEIAWNHYQGRRGLAMPFTQQVVEKLRPEGASFQADNVGFGTLLFFRPVAGEAAVGQSPVRPASEAPRANPTAVGDWQWSVPVPERAGRAFLWIPPDCAHVRAIVVGQNNMLEQGILEHDTFRRALASLGMAEVFVAPPFDKVFQFDRGAGERFDAMMRALAAASGYDEVASAPVIPIGHSACASFPWNFAAWNPGRTLAVLSIKGDAPQTDLTGSGKPNPDWGDRTIDGIPGLMVMSEAEWWDARLTPLLAFRNAHPAAPIGLLADVGRSHFDSSDALVEFLARFIRKAAAVRLAETTGAALRPVDSARGWLVDRWRGDEPLRAAAAPFASYKGDRAEALWCFDEEMARATESYYARMRGKKVQQVDFVAGEKFVPVSTSHAGVELKFTPLEDGVTFRVGADFIAPLPPKPPIAAKDRPPPPTIVTPTAAAPGSHAAGPVRISPITGPVLRIDEQTFRVALDRTASTTDRRGESIWLLAWHPGDANFKSAVQQAVLNLPRNRAGAEQRISFDEIPAQTVGAKSVALHASSSAGADVKVYFYVREGPAEIEGDGATLRFTAIPPRAKFPVKVTVVAWQFGRATEPKLQAAPPVERSFFISE